VPPAKRRKTVENGVKTVLPHFGAPAIAARASFCRLSTFLMRRSRSTTWIISLWAIRTRAAAAPSWGLTQLRTALVTAAPARHEIGDLANRRRIDPDRSPAPDRPDALEQQLHRPEVALPSPHRARPRSAPPRPRPRAHRPRRRVRGRAVVPARRDCPWRSGRRSDENPRSCWLLVWIKHRSIGPRAARRRFWAMAFTSGVKSPAFSMGLRANAASHCP